MGWVTKDQLERARQIHVLDYILAYEAGDYKRVGNGYRLKTDDAVAVDENGWYCHKKGKGSRTALDYLVGIKGYGLIEAVCAILGENQQERTGKSRMAVPSSKAKTSMTVPTKSVAVIKSSSTDRPPLTLPIRNKDNNRVIAYLQSRGIDKAIIMDCINRGVLFESRYYHNAVFLGKDERGKTRFATMRSTVTKFMRDADGSDKKYGFTLPPNNPHSNDVAVFESPIDCLSHKALCKQGYMPHFDGWRISLGGTSELAMEHFLEIHPDVTHCVICTDDDKAGEIVAAKIAAISGITASRSLPPYGKDWNETLQAVKKAERAQNKARASPCL